MMVSQCFAAICSVAQLSALMYSYRQYHTGLCRVAGMRNVVQLYAVLYSYTQCCTVISSVVQLYAVLYSVMKRERFCAVTYSSV